MHNIDDIKIGDIIASYFAGYHSVTQIEDRGKGNPPLIHFKTIAKANGKRINGNLERCCCASYCRYASVELARRINELEKELSDLKKFRDSLA